MTEREAFGGEDHFQPHIENVNEEFVVKLLPVPKLLHRVKDHAIEPCLLQARELETDERLARQ